MLICHHGDHHLQASGRSWAWSLVQDLLAVEAFVPGRR